MKKKLNYVIYSIIITSIAPSNEKYIKWNENEMIVEWQLN